MRNKEPRETATGRPFCWQGLARIYGIRAAIPVWAVLVGLFLFLVIAIVFILAPAFFLAGLIIVAGLLILIIHRTPTGTAVAVILIIIGAALALLAQGQALSISLLNQLALSPHH